MKNINIKTGEILTDERIEFDNSEFKDFNLQWVYKGETKDGIKLWSWETIKNVNNI